MARYNDDRPEATDWPDERWTLSDPSGCGWSDEEQYIREGLVMAHVEPGDAHDDLMERCPTCGKRGCVGYCDYRDLTDRDPDFDDPPAEDPERPWRCVVCGVNWVDCGAGFDTCDDCLARQ
jgi:hypothetical protein